MITTPCTSYVPYTRRTENDKRLQNAKTAVMNYEKELTCESQQLIKGAMGKGASSWLLALPIKAIGYALNKQEFMDAVCMTLCLWRDKFCGSQPHM